MKRSVLFFSVALVASTNAIAQSSYSGVYFDKSSSQYFVNDKPKFSIRGLGKGQFLDKIEYSLNDDAFKQYQGSIGFANEGLHLLRFKAVDPVNNWSPVQSFRIYVDLTTPKSQVSWFGPHYNDGKTNYVSASSEISLAASDNLSGVSQVLWKKSLQANSLIFKKKMNFSKSGQYSISYSAVDNVGNTESWSNYSFIVDSSKPSTEAKIKGDVFKVKNKLYTNLGAAIDLVASDPDSGIKDIEYKLNNKSVSKYEQSFSVDSKVSKLKFRAVDNVGNTEGWKSFSVYLDTDSPKISVKKKGRFEYVSGRIYAKPGLKLTANAFDSDSGVKNLIVDGVENKSSNHTLTYDKEGQFEVNLSAIDNVGNKADPKNLQVIIDNTSPSSKLSSNLELVERSGVYYSTIPNKIKLSGKDSGVGLKHIEYSYDGKNFKRLVGDIDLATWKSSQRTLYYRGVDHLGNYETVNKKTIAIRAKGPKVGLFVETQELGNIPLSKVKRLGGRIPASK